MERDNRGAGRRGEPTPSQAGRPEQKQTPQQRGEGIRGVPPPPQGEQGKPQQERGERQPLPSAWDVLERRVRLDAPDIENRPRGQEYDREHHEMLRLKNEIWEKGTARDKFILDLFNSITIQPGERGPSIRDLSLQEFHQLRSQVEPLSEEEIREEIRKQEAVKTRLMEEARKSGRILTLSPRPTVFFTPSLDHLIDELNQHNDQ